MTTLFEFYGIELPEQNLFIQDQLLRELAIKIALEQNTKLIKENNHLCNCKLDTVQEYFNIKHSDLWNSMEIKANVINRLTNYLTLQDILECRSIKEIHSLASGLYDTVFIKFILLIRMMIIKEIELNKHLNKELIKSNIHYDVA